MNRLNGIFYCLLLFSTALFAQPEGRNRADIDEKYKWNLGDLFTSRVEWENGKNALSEKFSQISDFKGELANSADMLHDGLEIYFSIRLKLYLLYTYALQLSDQDLRNSEALSMKQEMAQLETEFNKVSAFINPEILAIPATKMETFIAEHATLKKYAQYIDDIQRKQQHTLSTSEEVLVAEAERMERTAQDIYTVFSNAELPRPTITLGDGREVRLDASGYGANRSSNNREDRIKVFEAFFGALINFKGTLGAGLAGEVQKNLFFKNVRRYESSVERALDENFIPVSVYKKLIENTHKNLPVLHRYLNLRKRMLGLDELHYYDMYPSLVKEVDLTYNYDEATHIVSEALKPLGQKYVAALDRAYSERWIDVYPNTGKKSGAYSTDENYGVHPYILLNYNGQYTDMSTLAHEVGHALHSFFSNANQPYVNSLYPIFLAEVASTANEALLIDYELKRIKDPAKRLSLLGNFLESYRTTMFRQTQFAEFELRIHEEAEQGKALTGDRFTKIYLDILKKYYGHDEGVTVIDDLYGIEWAYIPHFYYNFYVYQYSTSFLASQALAEKMLSGTPGMVEKYLDFLSSGRSDYAIPTLKKVDIDMTSDEPFTLAMLKMNRIMDEIEKLLTETGR